MLCYLVTVLNELVFEMGEKLKEVQVTSEYSHVGLPTQVVSVSSLYVCYIYILLLLLQYFSCLCQG